VMIDFTHQSYLDLLAYVQAMGYDVVPFRDAPASGSYVILRHDIDFSIPKAIEMAGLDRQAGVHSTFFVLLTAPYYNPLSEEGLAGLRQIIGMGHEMGLHYDCTGFDRLTPDGQKERVDRLVACLEDHLGIHVTSISQHKPTESNVKPEIPGYVDAYSRPFFKDIAYVSDSRMMFRVPDLRAFFQDHPRSQALIHPIWWHARQKTRAEAFECIKSQLGTSFDAMLDAEHRGILGFLNGQT
jgi:hypothetical protein